MSETFGIDDKTFKGGNVLIFRTLFGRQFTYDAIIDRIKSVDGTVTVYFTMLYVNGDRSSITNMVFDKNGKWTRNVDGTLGYSIKFESGYVQSMTATLYPPKKRPHSSLLGVENAPEVSGST